MRAYEGAAVRAGAGRGPGFRGLPRAWLLACLAALAVVAGLTLSGYTADPGASAAPAHRAASARAADPPFGYVVNTRSETVSVVDTTTNTVVKTIPVGPGPQENPAVAPDGRHVYVTHITSPGSVSVIATSPTDPANDAVVKTIPVGDNPAGAVVAPDGRHVYVANYTNPGSVSVIETADNTVVKTIPVGEYPYGVAVTPDGGHVYVTHYTIPGSVSVIETADNTVVKTIDVGTFAQGVAVTPDGGHVYVASDSGPGEVAVIETAGNTVVKTIEVGGFPWDVAITPDGGHVYVSSVFGPSAVWAIETAGNTVVKTIPVGQSPRGVAVTPDGGHVYVANTGSDDVSVIATETNTVTDTIPGFEAPFGIAIGPAVSPSAPSLTIAKEAQGSFTQLGHGSYMIRVGNAGPGPTDGTTVTVRDTLPPGLQAQSISGEGWDCTLATLTCTRSDVLEAEGSYPPITLTVRVTCQASETVTNTATVTGGGDTETHTATADTTIEPSEQCQQEQKKVNILSGNLNHNKVLSGNNVNAPVTVAPSFCGSPIGLLAGEQRGVCIGNYHPVNAGQNIQKAKKKR